MKQLIIAIVIIIITLSACNSKTEAYKDFTAKGMLKLSMPASVIIEENAGIDSYIFKLKKDGMQLICELGKQYTYQVFEGSYYYFDIRDKDSILREMDPKLDRNRNYFSENPQMDQELAIANKNYFFYDTINGLTCRFAMPKKIGNGLTGVYIAKLDSGYSYSMYGKNLDSASHQLAIEIMKTIRPVKH